MVRVGECLCLCVWVDKSHEFMTFGNMFLKWVFSSCRIILSSVIMKICQEIRHRFRSVTQKVIVSSIKIEYLWARGGAGHDWNFLDEQVEMETASPRFYHLLHFFLFMSSMRWKNEMNKTCPHVIFILPLSSPPPSLTHSRSSSFLIPFFDFNEMSIWKRFLPKMPHGKQCKERKTATGAFSTRLSTLWIFYSTNELPHHHVYWRWLVPSSLFFLASVALCIFKDVFIWLFFWLCSRRGRGARVDFNIYWDTTEGCLRGRRKIFHK